MNTDPGDTDSVKAKSGLSERVEQNLEALVALQRREWEQHSPSERRVERISRVIGSPLYLTGLGLFAITWILWNGAGPYFYVRPFDSFPFPLLEGLLTFAALVTTTVVLIAQGLQTKLERQHTHLALQVNLLTEQKVTQVILLLEELRRDLPMVKDRHDAQSEALQQQANAAHVLTAIEQAGLMDEVQVQPKAPSEAKSSPD